MTNETAIYIVCYRIKHPIQGDVIRTHPITYTDPDMASKCAQQIAGEKKGMTWVAWTPLPDMGEANENKPGLIGLDGGRNGDVTGS